MGAAGAAGSGPGFWSPFHSLDGTSRPCCPHSPSSLLPRPTEWRPPAVCVLTQYGRGPGWPGHTYSSGPGQEVGGGREELRTVSSSPQPPRGARPFCARAGNHKTVCDLSLGFTRGKRSRLPPPPKQNRRYASSCSSSLFCMGEWTTPPTPTTTGSETRTYKTRLPPF